MSGTIDIRLISHTEVSVNGKPVHRDMNGNWVAQIELTEREVHRFYRYLADKTDEENE